MNLDCSRPPINQPFGNEFSEAVRRPPCRTARTPQKAPPYGLVAVDPFRHRLQLWSVKRGPALAVLITLGIRRSAMFFSIAGAELDAPTPNRPPAGTA